MNQLGLVREVLHYDTLGGGEKYRYRVWLFGINRHELISDRDFEDKNLELVSRASGDNSDLGPIAITCLKKLKKYYL